MNELNCGSREACQKLHKAGIVVETEAVWIKHPAEWELTLRERVEKHLQYIINVPALSMAEAWRELPENESEIIDLIERFLEATVASWLHTDLFIETIKVVKDINRMIDLLIWVRKQT